MANMKYKIGDYIYYNDDTEEFVCRIYSIEMIDDSDSIKKYNLSEIMYILKKGNHKGKQMYFEDTSAVDRKCRVGKTLDELWVRMI